MQDIKKYFDKAKLPLFITDKSIGRFVNDKVGDKIFQMTIDKSGNKSEFFRIFRGGVKNDIRVLDVDPKKEQLLLYVKEPKRTFKTVHYDTTQKKDIEDSHTTPEAIRRYLMGMDERHLFVSELPDNVGKVNNVKDAFRILKPRDVKDRKKRKKAKIYRQGEWFFVPATRAEMLMIEEKIKFVTKKEAIEVAGRGGSKPHIAEELLRITTDRLAYPSQGISPVSPGGWHPFTKEGIFIKGKVTHIDHKTRNFTVWHRVFRNTEKIIRGDAAIQGWID